jgi:hypothetical protein
VIFQTVPLDIWMIFMKVDLSTQMPYNWWMDQEIVIYIYIYVYLSVYLSI